MTPETVYKLAEEVPRPEPGPLVAADEVNIPNIDSLTY
jgi:hypothetical protein